MTRSLGWTLFLSMATATLLVVGAAWALASDDADLNGVLLRAAIGAHVVCGLLALGLVRWLGTPVEVNQRTANRLTSGQLGERGRPRRCDAVV